MDDLEVVDVHANGDDLAVGMSAREHTGVGVIQSGEALCDEPGEEHAL